MAKYGPAKKSKIGWIKVGTDARGRRHLFLAEYPWHLENHKFRHHAHYWEDTLGGKICQQVIHDKVHILPVNYDAGDPSDWTETAMRRWFDMVVREYKDLDEGMIFYSNGDVYEGGLNREGFPNGIGMLTTKEGMKFKGYFKEGKYVGF